MTKPKLSAEEPPTLVPRDVDGDDDDRDLKLDVDTMKIDAPPPPPSFNKDTPWNGEDVHYLMLPRSSLGNFYWLSQIFTLLYACVFRIFIWGMHPGCNVTVNRCVFLSKGQSRHEMNKSDAIVAFLLTIMAIPLEHKVIVTATDADRIGVVLRYSMALTQILLYRPNLEIVIINQHGISVVTSLELAALNNETRKENGQTSDHTNAGKGIAAQEDAIDKIEAIEEAFHDFRQRLSDEDSEESNLVLDAKTLGDALEAEISAATLDDMAKDLAEKVRQVESGKMTADEAVEDLHTSFLAKVPNQSELESVAQGDSLDVAFTRNSRVTKGRSKTTHGVLTHQVARCFAAKGYHDSETKAKTKTLACVIQDSNVNRDKISRSKLAMLLVLVFYGMVDTLYLSTLVRLSNSVDVIKIFIAALAKFDVRCVAVDCVGKDLMTVAEAEVSRLLELSRATQAKNDAEDAERDKMSPLEQFQSWIMRAIGHCHFGNHVHLTEIVDDGDGDMKIPAKKKSKKN